MKSAKVSPALTKLRALRSQSGVAVAATKPKAKAQTKRKLTDEEKSELKKLKADWKSLGKIEELEGKIQSIRKSMNYPTLGARAVLNEIRAIETGSSGVKRKPVATPKKVGQGSSRVR